MACHCSVNVTTPASESAFLTMLRWGVAKLARASDRRMIAPTDIAKILDRRPTIINIYVTTNALSH